MKFKNITLDEFRFEGYEGKFRSERNAILSRCLNYHNTLKRDGFMIFSPECALRWNFRAAAKATGAILKAKANN